jgi:hypothetical protein
MGSSVRSLIASEWLTVLRHIDSDAALQLLVRDNHSRGGTT